MLEAYRINSKSHCGIGGRVGLKGSDGQEIQAKALEMGAKLLSPKRTVEALDSLRGLDGFQFVTYPGKMGEDEIRAVGLEPQVIGETGEKTTAEDTRRAARDLLKMGVDFVVFSGGDGTARDIYTEIKDAIPVLGIPTGVKIHSGVYAINPRSAGNLLIKYLKGSTDIKLGEVMDIDENAFRENIVQAKLYGYMKVVYDENLIQGGKEGRGISDASATIGVANEFFEELDEDTFYILGPGTTTKPIADGLGIEKTLLGVDVVQWKSFTASDVNENQLLNIINGKKVKLYVTIIGGQGFVFGRGNQQLSPEVIRIIGKENIEIVATPEKIASLRGKPLRVDTGDIELDEELKGFYKIRTGYRHRTVYKIGD